MDIRTYSEIDNEIIELIKSIHDLRSRLGELYRPLQDGGFIKCANQTNMIYTRVLEVEDDLRSFRTECETEAIIQGLPV